jgi:hypothetical protein
MVIPVYRIGFVPKMHRFLWSLHNRLSAIPYHEKLGEVVAVRKAATDLRSKPVVGCDEVLLEASVVESGYRLAYASSAVVHNLAPTAFADYLAQRSRIHLQHLVTSRELGYGASTMSVFNGVRVMVVELLTHPEEIPVAIGCAIFEILGRGFAIGLFRRGERMVSWSPSVSARLTTKEPAENPGTMA